MTLKTLSTLLILSLSSCSQSTTPEKIPVKTDHFWFSQQQRELYTWSRPGYTPHYAQLTNGKKVEYTEITSSTKQFGRWPDYKYLGTGTPLELIP